MTLAILSSTGLPRFLGDDHPDEQALFAEGDELITAFAARGVAAERVPWRREPVSWSNYDSVLIRSTWDYLDDVAGFLEVLACIDNAGCRLLNPLETIRWNLDKRYLGELREAGVPVVPSCFVEPGATLAAAVDELGPSAGGYVLKPTIGVGGFGTTRFRNPEDVVMVASDDPAGTYLVQPFVDAVAGEGEWSFVFGAGCFLYAALKTPASGEYRVQVMYGASTRAMTPEAADLRAAERCLGALPVPVALARIDMARMPDGTLALMEAELIEPQLFLFDVPGAAEAVAAAVLAAR